MEDADRLRQLDTFVRLVESSTHNLVSQRARGELRSRHVPECVALAGLLPAGPQRVLDVGSGGGFPGIVLAIVRPELEVHLVESTGKKAAFLSATAEELALAIDVHHGRAEQLSGTTSFRGGFDVVTARAVAPLDRLVGLTVPFLRVGGLLYAVKGARWEEEVQAAEAAMRRAGARVVATPRDLGGGGDTGSAPRVVMLARER